MSGPFYKLPAGSHTLLHTSWAKECFFCIWSQAHKTLSHLSGKRSRRCSMHMKEAFCIGYFRLLGLVPGRPMKLLQCQSLTTRALTRAINTVWLVPQFAREDDQVLTSAHKCQLLEESSFGTWLHGSLVSPSLPWAWQPWPGIGPSLAVQYPLPWGKQKQKQNPMEFTFKGHNFWNPRDHRQETSYSIVSIYLWIFHLLFTEESLTAIHLATKEILTPDSPHFIIRVCLG